jgi:NADPH2 dehydrogenase
MWGQRWRSGYRGDSLEQTKIVRLGSLKGAAQFHEYLESLGLEIPCDRDLVRQAESPLAQCLLLDGRTIGNRLATQPMEGWDGAPDGNPTEGTRRRWRRFGASGAKLIWGGEAVAVRHDGRANPNQLMIAPNTLVGLRQLRQELIAAHRATTGSDDGLLIGLQLTHSGRYSRPNSKERPEPRILYHHPLLDRRLGLPADYPILADEEICEIIEDFRQAARMAWQLGFDFVDIKHCHGYLGHEFLSAHTREGPYGGSFDNRTRFLREVVQGIRSAAPGLQIGVRLSAFDSVPFCPGPRYSLGKPGPGTPEIDEHLIPYRWGFGVNPLAPSEADLTETVRFLTLLKSLDIRLVNVTAGSPYYDPHIQRPALFPPSDGYEPPTRSFGRGGAAASGCS